MSERLFVLDELAGLTRGELFRGPGCAEEGVFSVVCDSRTAEAGSLFVPLQGERTDGHLYSG